MPDPTIVPPTPTVKQGEPIDTSAGIETVQAIFDKVIPPRGDPAAIEKQRSKLKEQAQAPAEPVKPAAEPVKEPAQPPVQPPQKGAEESHDVPSFLEQALRGEPSQAPPAAAPAAEEWPEELPEFKNSDEAKARYKAWRKAYGDVKGELTTLRERPSLNGQQLQRLEFLEGQNKQMSEVLTRFGVEQSAEFQNNILRPLHIAWNEAARIVKDAGGNPEELAKAMTLTGRAQFEALDTLFQELPESAKAEAHDALRTYRRFDDARKATLANAPQAMEGIRQRETQRQHAELSQQRKEMENLFNSALSRMRDEAKVEVFLKTDTEDGKWWNEQADRLVSQARELYMDNTDMGRVALACLLAPTADVYRNLWLKSQKKIGALNKIIKDRISSEPNLTENGGPGNIIPSDQQLQEDLKKPFADVFLREFHRSQQTRR